VTFVFDYQVELQLLICIGELGFSTKDGLEFY